MRERPILFSAPMVRALLDGTKTQTRRIVKLPHMNPLGMWEPGTMGGPNMRTRSGETVPEHPVLGHSRTGDCIGPAWWPGDRLWVREAWGFYDWPKDNPRNSKIIYRADGEPRRGDQKWRPSIHMTRAASRIQLGVTDVRVERLNDISEADAIAEGCHPAPCLRGDDDIAVAHAMRYLEQQVGRLRIDYPVARYMVLWESINGPGTWAANP